MLKLATFSLPYINIENLTGKNFPLGTESIYELNDENLADRLIVLEYGSIYLSKNMGSVFVIFTITLVGLLMIIVLYPLTINNHVIRKHHNKLKSFLMWNFCIRLVLEAGIEIIISSILNLQIGCFYGVPWGAKLNKICAIFFATLFVLSPFLISLFYCCNFHRLRDAEFIKKWGSTYEGLDVSRRISLVYPIIFVVKRMTFCFVVLFLTKWPTFQLFATLLMQLLVTCYLLHFRPFETRLLNNLEIFNEVVTNMIVVDMFLLTETYSLKVKGYGGYGFLFFIGFICAVQLSFLVRSTCQTCLKDCRRRAFSKRYTRWYHTLQAGERELENRRREMMGDCEYRVDVDEEQVS